MKWKEAPAKGEPWPVPDGCGEKRIPGGIFPGTDHQSAARESLCPSLDYLDVESKTIFVTKQQNEKQVGSAAAPETTFGSDAGDPAAGSGPAAERTQGACKQPVQVSVPENGHDV